MPTMNGSELYEEIAKINPNIKVLFMSWYAKEIIKSWDWKNFLQKPITFEILSGKVREILDRR
jgi:two-component SAPR family response regulator